MKTYKVLSLLLSYPKKEWLDHIAEFKQTLIDEQLLSKQKLNGLIKLIDRLGSADLIDAQENYVATFDRTPALSLHLFEHIHGESRDRGQAMIDLTSMYNANGFGIATSELPDYLPVFLEFLSSGTAKEASTVLAETNQVLLVIQERLAKKELDYSHVFSALTELSSARTISKDIKQMIANEADHLSFEEIDKQWVEPEAFGKNPFKSQGYLNQKIQVNLQASKGEARNSSGGLS